MGIHEKIQDIELEMQRTQKWVISPNLSVLFRKYWTRRLMHTGIKLLVSDSLQVTSIFRSDWCSLEDLHRISSRIIESQGPFLSSPHSTLWLTHSLCAQLARYRQELLEGSITKSVKGEGFDVAKAGYGRAVLIGFPSVGKSTLLSKVTNTESAAAAYAFTTLVAVPGGESITSQIQLKIVRLQAEGAIRNPQFSIWMVRRFNVSLPILSSVYRTCSKHWWDRANTVLDLPGIIEGASSGKGRGRQVVAVAKTADLVVVRPCWFWILSSAERCWTSLPFSRWCST